MREQVLESYWPVKPVRDADLYFYLEAIEEYSPDNRVRVAGHGDLLMPGGYSYLGLNGHPRINQAACRAIERYGTGHGAPMLAGTLSLHRELEQRIAEFKLTEAAAVFSSGYIANISTISCLLGRHDTVICDKLDHACIVDGALPSNAKVERFRHNDTEHLAALLASADRSKNLLVVVDAVYSMDGDIADLPEISRLCRSSGAWLMADEAHSTGVLGATGRGIEEHFGLPSDTLDIKMGTLSKAVPSAGGYIAGSRRLIAFLNHQARGFIYSGSLGAAATASALEAISIIAVEPERINRLHENTAYFAHGLEQAGFSYLDSQTAIFPILCGDDWKAWQMARACQRRGVYVQAIPYPVVPKGMARLRASVMATRSTSDLDFCVSVLQESAKTVGGIVRAVEPGHKCVSETADRAPAASIIVPAGGHLLESKASALV